MAVCLAERLAARRPGVLVAPALPYGASGEHAGFAGTLSIGQQALEHVVVELCRSATASVRRILLLNGHGGNVGALRRAVDLLRTEGRDVRTWSPHWPGDAHAGHTETSVQLALSPTRVRVELARRGTTTALAELLPALRASGVRAASADGVLGDPTRASAEHGRELLDAAQSDLLALVDGWSPEAGR